MVGTRRLPARGCGGQGSIPGRRGKGTVPGGSAEVTNRQHRRLGTSSPSSHRSVPLPAPSGEIYRLSKRSETKAMAGGEGIPAQPSSSSGTASPGPHRYLSSRSSSIAPRLQPSRVVDPGALPSPQPPRWLTGTCFCPRTAGERETGSSALPWRSVQPHHLAEGTCKGRCRDGRWCPLQGVSPEDGRWCPLQGAAGRASPEQKHPRCHAEMTKPLPRSKGGRQAEAGWLVRSIGSEHVSHSAPQGGLWARQKASSAPGRGGKLSHAPCHAAGDRWTWYCSVLAQQALPGASSLDPRDQHQLGWRVLAA